MCSHSQTFCTGNNSSLLCHCVSTVAPSLVCLTPTEVLWVFALYIYIYFFCCYYFFFISSLIFLFICLQSTGFAEHIMLKRNVHRPHLDKQLPWKWQGLVNTAIRMFFSLHWTRESYHFNKKEEKKRNGSEWQMIWRPSSLSLAHRLCLLSGSFFHRVSLLTDPRNSHYIFFFFFLNLPAPPPPLPPPHSRPLFIACTLSHMKSAGQRNSISLHVCDCYRRCQSCVGGMRTG